MRLTYTTSVDDWLELAEHEIRRTPDDLDALFIWRWFVAILCGAIAAYVFADVSRLVSLVAGAATVAIVAWLFWRWTRLAARAAARREMTQKKHLPLFTSETSVEIGGEGLRWEGIAGYRLLRWPYIESVEETAGHVFVHLPMHSGFVIPRSAVATEALSSFLAKLRQQMEQALPGSPREPAGHVP